METLHDELLMSLLELVGKDDKSKPEWKEKEKIAYLEELVWGRIDFRTGALLIDRSPHDYFKLGTITQEQFSDALKTSRSHAGRGVTSLEAVACLPSELMEKLAKLSKQSRYEIKAHSRVFTEVNGTIERIQKVRKKTANVLIWRQLKEQYPRLHDVDNQIEALDKKARDLEARARLAREDHGVWLRRKEQLLSKPEKIKEWLSESTEYAAIDATKIDLELQPLESLDLSVRVFNSLRWSGIYTVAGLVERVERGQDAMLAIRNFGEKARKEVMSKLVERGYLVEVNSKD